MAPGDRNPPIVHNKDVYLNKENLTVKDLTDALSGIPPDTPLWLNDPEYHDDPDGVAYKMTIVWSPEHAYREGATVIEEHVAITIWHPC